MQEVFHAGGPFPGDAASAIDLSESIRSRRNSEEAVDGRAALGLRPKVMAQRGCLCAISYALSNRLANERGHRTGHWYVISSNSMFQPAVNVMVIVLEVLFQPVVTSCSGPVDTA